MADDVDLSRLALGRFDLFVIRGAYESRARFGIADFLVSSRHAKAAERMITKGYLTKSPHQTVPSLGVVVRLTLLNWERLKQDAARGTTQ